jgi:hypothetical protein
MRTKESKLWLSLAVAVVVTAGFAFEATAAEKGSARGGASDLTMKPIRTQADAEALKPGDELAMVCSKCKSVVIHRVNTEKGHIKTMTVGEKHLCPGCDSTIEVTGFGKGKHDEVKHVCKACGDESAFCCATKAGTTKAK